MIWTNFRKRHEILDELKALEASGWRCGSCSIFYRLLPVPRAVVVFFPHSLQTNKQISTSECAVNDQPVSF